MKRPYRVIIGFGLLGCSLTACKKDFLDTTDPTRIGANVFYQNETQFQQALSGVYGQLQGITNGAYLFAEMPSDNTTADINTADRGDAVRYEALEYWTYNSGNTEFGGLWNGHYSALYNTNYTLGRLQGSSLDAAVKGPIEGQLKFLRAYFYFNLTQYFGDVVLATTTVTSPSEAFALVRSPQAEVYAQIEKDLTDAVALLPATYPAAQVGRVTKGAALSLLGKVYLTEKKYGDAVTQLKQVTGYSLNANYADNFNPAKKNGPESIFEVQYQGGNNLGEWSSFAYTFAPRASAGAITGYASNSPGGRNIPTNDMIAAYEPGDLRKDASLKTSYTLNGKVVTIPYIIKYTHPHTISGRTDDNWPVLRYSDVLLMLAEAINEQSGPTGEAVGYLNQVRMRAGLPARTGLDKDAFRTAVLKERRVELAFENYRWFDLKRTMTPAQLTAFLNAYGAREKANPTVSRGGVPFNAQDYVFSPYQYYYPIPSSEILVNSNLTQNSGY